MTKKHSLVKCLAFVMAFFVGFSSLPANNLDVMAAEWATGGETAPTAVENLTYNGNAQNLVTGGAGKSNYTVKYKVTQTENITEAGNEADLAALNSQSWTTSPQGTDAGTYYVYYFADDTQSEADDNPVIGASADVQAPIAVTISGRALTADDFEFTAPANLVYDGQNKDVAGATTQLTGVTPSTSFYLSGNAVDNVNAAGEYTAKVTATSTNPNYVALTEATEIGTFNVGEATMTLAFTNATVNLAYGEFATNAATTTTEDVNISYESNNTDVATVDEDGKITAVGVGLAVITATATKDNYSNATATCAVTVSEATWTQLTAEGAVVVGGESEVALTSKICDDGVATLPTNATYTKVKDVAFNSETKKLTFKAADGAHYGDTEDIVLNVASDHYADYSITVTVTIGKANVVLSDVEATAIKYGQFLSASTVSGVAKNEAGEAIEGTWAWKNVTKNPGTGEATFVPGEIVPDYDIFDGVTEFVAVFTPASDDYVSVETDAIALDVNPADVTINITKSIDVIKGQPISYFDISSLEAGEDKDYTATSVIGSGANSVVPVEGEWAWKTSGSTVVTEDNLVVEATFTPNVARFATTTVNVTINLVDLSARNLAFTDETVEKVYGDDNFVNELKSSVENKDYDDSDAEYSSSDETVATVDENGEVTILKAGTTTITVFCPQTQLAQAETASYTLTVAKADPYIKTLPTAAALFDGQTLADSEISGGAVQHSLTVDTSVAGTFTWKAPTTSVGTLDSNKTQYAVVFTPTGADADKYNTVESKIRVTVNAKIDRHLAFDSTEAINVTYHDADIDVAALGLTATNGGTDDVVYEVTGTAVSPIIDASTNKVTGFQIEGAGEATITASAPSTAQYNEDETATAKKIVVAKFTPAVFVNLETENVIVGKTLNDVVVNEDAKVYVHEPAGDTPEQIAAAIEIPGTFTWKQDEVAPVPPATEPTYEYKTLDTIGATTGILIFTPNDTNNYEVVEKELAVNVVDKETRNLAFASDSVDKFYGDADFTNTLSGKTDGVVYSVVETNGVVTVNETTGKVSIKKVGSATIKATATESDLYKADEATYTITVAKATPYIATAPTASAINGGQNLASSTLTGGKAQVSETNTVAVSGTWAWKDNTALPSQTNQEFTVVFTPSAPQYYNSAEVNVKVRINHTHTLVKVAGTAATCLAEGTKDYWECTVTGCEDKFLDAAGTMPVASEEDLVIAKLPHQMTKTAAVAKTCTTDGNIEYWTCSLCHNTYADEAGTTEITPADIILPRGHEITAHAAKEPTCTEDGNFAYYECTVCEKYFSDEAATDEITDKTSVVRQKTGHSATHHDAVAATCTTTGNIEYWECSKCEKKFSDEALTTEVEDITTPKTTLTAHEAKDATCEEAGNIAYWECPDCGKLYSDADATAEITLADTVVPATGHTVELVPATEPTCGKEGNTAYYKCTACEKYFSDEAAENEIADKASVIVAPLPHTLTAHEAKAATCTEAGNIAYWTCDVCEKVFSDENGKTEITMEETVVPATHKLTAIEANEATCTEDGNLAYWMCSDCKKLFSDAEGKTEVTAADVVVPAKGHKLTKVDAVAPTCEKAGTKAYWLCSDCLTKFLDADGKTPVKSDSELTVPATDHDWGEWVVITEPTTEKEGLERRTCKNDSSHFEERTIAKIDTVSVTGIKAPFTKKTLKVGESTDVEITVTPSNATNKEVNGKSSNTSVVKVISGGLVAVGVGSATVTYTSADDSSIKTTVRVYVIKNPTVSYKTYVQKKGWTSLVKNGAYSGTKGLALRLEGIKITLSGVAGNISYRTYVQKQGWEKTWASNGQISGTMGMARRLEAIQIKLSGNAATLYDVYYRCYAQKFGWLGWAKNGAAAGTAGYGYRLEGVCVKLVDKGGKAPGSTANAYRKNQ